MHRKRAFQFRQVEMKNDYIIIFQYILAQGNLLI